MEVIIANGSKEPEIVIDYTKLHGSETSPEELDKVKLAFTDPVNYRRIMIEWQREQNAK